MWKTFFAAHNPGDSIDEIKDERSVEEPEPRLRLGPPGVSGVSWVCGVAEPPLQCARAGEQSDEVEESVGESVGSPLSSVSTVARWSECMATPARETATPKENHTRSLGGITCDGVKTR